MTTLLRDIQTIGNGARFYTADLHVHTFGASHDVRDANMTVQAVIDAAVAKSIGILSFTDHNSAENVVGATEYAQKYAGSLLFLPGVEVTTPQGHLLAYFAPTDPEKVRDLLARIRIVGEYGSENSHTTMSMPDVIQEIEHMGGLAVAAHIDKRGTGMDAAINGYGAAKQDIVRASGLYALEIADATNLHWYGPDDDATNEGVERRRLLGARTLQPATAGRPHLARIQGSDSHRLVDFARRADCPLTRYKLDELTFEALRTALVDPGARVRPTQLIPRSFPRVRGMSIEGGFLDGQVFHFSDNLNCFIGGRGTGKSTAIRSLAYGLGAIDDFEEHDNCPDTVTVYCEDEGGVIYRYERTRRGSLVVKAKEDQTIADVPYDAFRVEYYGQGDLAEVAKDPLRNPQLLQDFLDRHIRLGDLLSREKELTELLEQNSSQLVPLEAQWKQLPEKQAAAEAITKKLRIAEEGKLQELVAKQVKLGNERSLQTSIEEVRKLYSRGVSLARFYREFATLAEAAGEGTGDQRSKAAFDAIAAVLSEASQHLQQAEADLNAKLKTVAGVLAKETASLSQAHWAIDTDIQVKVEELQKKGLSGSIRELQELVRQRAALTSELTRLNAKKPQLDQLRADREALVSDLDSVRDEMMSRRKEQLRTINRNLAKTITDYIVFVQYDQVGLTEPFVRLVSRVMQGSYFPEEAAKKLCAGTTPRVLAEHIRERNRDGLAAMPGLSANWADAVLERFKDLRALLELEVLWKAPCPIIVVRQKNAPTKTIPANQLSDGQKHTILLTIAMLAESNLPLIIDQPEDDLDNAFVFATVVSTLRDIKEHRQIIAVTHNSNIAVLGDAELLLPMRQGGGKGVAFDCGSIDSAATKKAVQEILEGGEVAFRKRKEIYGH